MGWTVREYWGTEGPQPGVRVGAQALGVVTGDSGWTWEGDSVSKLEPGKLGLWDQLARVFLSKALWAEWAPPGGLQIRLSASILRRVRKGPGEGGPWPTALGKASGRTGKVPNPLEGPFGFPCVPAAPPQGDRRNCVGVLVPGRTPPVGQATLPLQWRGATDLNQNQKQLLQVQRSLSGPWRLEIPRVFVYQKTN